MHQRGEEIFAASMALENKFLSNSEEDIEQPTQETDTQETEEDNNFSDDLSDSGDDSDVEFAAVPKAFEPVVPRNLKRTYGIIVDDLRSERRIKTAKLDEQLQYLRHIIPDTHRDEKAHVLFDAYHYIMRLQRRVEDLNAELIPLQNSRSETSETPTVQSSRAPRHQPTVEVTRKEGKLEVRIECVNRPGLLVDIMGALESSRLTVLQASIACHGDILFEALSLESDEGAATSDHDLFIEDEGVKANLVRAISQDRADCALQ